MRQFALLSLAGLLWLTACALALAAPAGTAVGVDPAAEADLNNAARTLVVGSDVSIGDTVITGPTGEVQLLFSDQTKLLVGPKSSLVIEAYLLRNSNSVTQFSVDALAGTYRFITGNSAKSAYRIDTPTGMIGVRGTAFDFTVDATGTTLVLFHGAVRLCNLSNQCTDLSQTCGVATMAGAGTSVLSRSQQAAQNLRARFRYVQSDAGLLPAFQSAGSGNCLRATATTPRATIVRPARPTRMLPPGRGTYRPPLRVEDPCDHLDQLSRAERVALLRQHLCRPQVDTPNPFGNGGLITVPFPTHRPPRGRGDGPVLQ